MANTCTTNYVLEGEGAQIRALYSGLKELESCHDSSWLGNIVEKILGLDSKKIDCRGEFGLGEISNCPYDDDSLTLDITTFTAWSPCYELFEKLADKYDCNIYWIAEELGCGLFESNDSEEKYFQDTIIVDSPEHGCQYFSNQEDALKAIQDEVDDKITLTWEQAEELEDFYLYEVDYV